MKLKRKEQVVPCFVAKMSHIGELFLIMFSTNFSSTPVSVKSILFTH